MFSSALFTLSLLGFSSFVHSFPTVENVAKLGASAPQNLHKALLELQTKRLHVLTEQPIDGKPRMPFQHYK